MANYLELMKKVHALVIDNVMLTHDNVRLKERLATLETENKSLMHKNNNLVELIENLNEQINELDEECEELYNKCEELNDELEDEKSSVINYIAVSLDLSTCVPLVSESPIEAGQELMKKCLTKGLPYGGFKVFEKSELL